MESRKEREPVDHTKTYVEKMLESSSKITQVAEVALKAAEEKGLTFREVMYLPEAIDARIKDEIKKKGEPFRRTP